MLRSWTLIGAWLDLDLLDGDGKSWLRNQLLPVTQLLVRGSVVEEVVVLALLIAGAVRAVAPGGGRAPATDAAGA